MATERNGGGLVSRRTVLQNLAVGVPGMVAAEMLASTSAGAAEGTVSTGRGRLKQSVSQWCYKGKLSIEQLISEADQALYFGKHNGRDQYRLYQEIACDLK